MKEGAFSPELAEGCLFLLLGRQKKEEGNSFIEFLRRERPFLRKSQFHKHPDPLKPVLPTDFLTIPYSSRMVGDGLLMDLVPPPCKHACDFRVEPEIVLF